MSKGQGESSSRGETNLEGTLNVLEAARKQGSPPPLLFTSTHKVYGDLRDVDLLNAMLLAMGNIDALAGKAFNIGGDPENAVSLLEVINCLAELSGLEPQIRYGPPRKGDQPYYVSDTRHFTKATGWMPQVPAEQGILQLHNWIAENAHSGLGVLQPRE